MMNKEGGTQAGTCDNLRSTLMARVNTESLIMEHASETSWFYCQPECSLLLHCQQSDASDEVTPNLDCMTEGKYYLNSVIIWLFVCVFFSPSYDFESFSLIGSSVHHFNNQLLKLSFVHPSCLQFSTLQPLQPY